MISGNGAIRTALSTYYRVLWVLFLSVTLGYYTVLSAGADGLHVEARHRGRRRRKGAATHVFGPLFGLSVPLIRLSAPPFITIRTTARSERYVYSEHLFPYGHPHRYSDYPYLI
jgi:hypothetical protein